jgi:hypothetical protein
MDRGRENVDVADYMISYPDRGMERGSAVTGKIVHNERFERLWRDLFMDVCPSSTTCFIMWS